MTADIVISVHPRKLSDDTVVFDVCMYPDTIIMHAETEAAACKLAAVIAAAINQYTVDVAEVH